ncbi:hypothetical protein J1785_00095, partial [Rahnella sp. SL6]|uniref:hypothetical protein n=1 Tax=Rahnella perminowiae TaxID=2816244 RepID=UPI001C27C3C9
RFTSEFGMGSGGTTALVPPGKFCFIRTATHQGCSPPRRHTNQSRNIPLKIYSLEPVSQIKTPLVL